MKRISALCFFALLMTGCAAYRTAGQVQAGRQALLTNNPEAALGYFQQAAEQDSNYVFTSVLFREGVLTYLGRTQYSTGRLPEAQRSLERAWASDQEDSMARLYLGLTQARRGAVAAGVIDIESALKSLYNWIDYVASRRLTRGYWDPSRQIRNEIEKILQSISGKDFELETLLSNSEWIGREIEEEIERVRREEGRDSFDRERMFRPGVSLGVDIRF